MDTQAHRWIVDSIEESVASIEIDGSRIAQVPVWVLPRHVREGDVLAVRHEMGNDGQQSTLHIAVDREATRLALEVSARQAKKGERSRNDPGGNISF